MSVRAELVRTILWMDLPSRHPRGHEQEGERPCLVLADPSTVQPIRHPVLLVAPLTRTQLEPGPLYIRLQAGTGGLPATSTLLLDQLLIVDTRRIKGFLGYLSEDDFAPILAGLRAMLGV